MRTVAVALIILSLGLAPRVASACLPDTPMMLHGQSPNDHDLPLRGSIFIGSITPPRLIWVEGRGSTTIRIVDRLHRIDYVAERDAVLLVDRTRYVLTSRAVPPAPLAIEMHRTDFPVCNTVSMNTGSWVAALRVRLTSGDDVRDQWLVNSLGNYEVTECKPTAIEVIAILPGGTEHVLQHRISILDVPIRVSNVSDEALPIDLAQILALLGVLAVAITGVIARPRSALHGLTMRCYLPKLRFRIRLPIARVRRRRA